MIYTENYYNSSLAVDSVDPQNIIVSTSESEDLLMRRMRTVVKCGNQLQTIFLNKWNNYFHHCSKSKACRRILCYQQPCPLNIKNTFSPNS
jgi:hypothetical protein